MPLKNVIVLDEQLHVEWNTPFNRAAVLQMFKKRLISMLDETDGPDVCIEDAITNSMYAGTSDVDQWHIGDVWFNVTNVEQATKEFFCASPLRRK